MTSLDLFGGERYRLALCPELNGDRSVLVVQMTIQLFLQYHAELVVTNPAYFKVRDAMTNKLWHMGNSQLS